MNASLNPKNLLLLSFASGTLHVQDRDSLDATTKKLISRMEEIDRQLGGLKSERNAIMTALSVAGWRPPASHKQFFTGEESDYRREQPFKSMSLTDACLKVLRDHVGKEEVHAQWLDKNQVEYLVNRGGFEFQTEDSTNSVNVTLRRLAEGGLCEAQGGKGSRGMKYHFKRDREPRTTKSTKAGE
jgi:hypothetical protein